MGQFTADSLTYKTSETKARYSSMLVDVMKSMEQHLQAMEPTKPETKVYLNDVQKVAATIKAYAGDFCQLSLFFLVRSSHYQPNRTDPEFFAAGILQYCLRLDPQREGPSFQLFYYLLGGWKKAIVSGEDKMRKHTVHLKKAMKHAGFMRFLLTDFIPAILRTGFRSIWTQPSIIYLAYLPSLASRVAELLIDDEAEARATFHLVINLLRMVMNCLLAKQDYTVLQRFPCPQRLERSVRTVACQFWFEITPSLMNYVQRFRNKAPEDEQGFWEVHKPFVHYMERMAERLNPPYTCKYDWMIPQWPVEEGESCVKFEAALEEDIRDRRTVAGCREIRIGAKIHLVSLSVYEEMTPTFESVLQYGHTGYDEGVPALYNSLIREVVP
jgi:hypothetical protein